MVVVLCARAFAAPSPTEVAKRHYELGAQAYEKQDYATALREFNLAYEISEQPDILFNLARVETKLGHERAAIDYLKRYIEKAPSANDVVSVRAEIDAREKALTAQAETATLRANQSILQQPAGRAGVALVVLGGAMLVTGVAFNVVAALMSSSVERGTGMPVAFAGSTFQSDQALGRIAEPIGISFDVVGGVALGTGAGLLVWRARSRK